jgi:hydroxyacylglutathione hydrolase
MFFRQVLHEDLGCASYVVADGGKGAIVDPKWDIADYLRLTDEQDFVVEHVLETHNHADHLSGRGRLAEATGAALHISRDAEVDYEHEPLGDGDALDLGDARLTALATPGHRPEHISFLVEDRSRADTPWLVLTGDSLFVGDVARPDLAVEPKEGARGLFHTAKRLLELDDVTEVWPGHVGGSLCGGAGMSEKPVSTIGFERRHNELLGLGEDEFVRRLTSLLEPQPPNFDRIVELNRGPLLTTAGTFEPLAPQRALELVEAGATLVDGRDPREFDAAHPPGSLNVTMIQTGVGTRAAWVLELEADLVVLAAGDEDARHLAGLLGAVGFRRVAGYVAGGIGAWRGAKLETQSTLALDVKGLAERLWDEQAVLLDVREEDEWEQGHVAGSIHVPYRALGDGIPHELRAAGKPLAVACSAGNRSSLAASLLRRAGRDDVLHVADGGVADLADEGFELVSSS